MARGQDVFPKQAVTTGGAVLRPALRSFETEAVLFGIRTSTRTVFEMQQVQ